MDIQRELALLKKEVDYEIAIYLDRVISETPYKDVFIKSAIKYFKKTILAGGKRIRPIMMYWGYIGAGGKDRSEIIKASVSIELIHAFLLMHDDIVDRDDIRHGKKTMHAKYKEHYEHFFLGDDAVHFGESIAIISGDYLYSLGNHVLFASQFEPAIIIRALNKMQDIVGLTCVGEIQDIYMEYGKKATREKIMQMYENKTARYTFDGPLKLGAILAGADDELCVKMSKFAVPLGIAFQIRDDMLGVFGSMKKTGKPVGSDIAEGKMTLLVRSAYDHASQKQKKELDRLLGNKKIGAYEVEAFQQLMIDTGAKDDVDTYMQKLIDEARSALQEMTLSQEAKEFLFALTEYLSNRDK